MNKNHITLLLGATALFLSINVQAEIYKWVDAKGITHYTATPPPQKTVKNKTKVESIEVQILSAAGKFKPKADQTTSNSEKTSEVENKNSDNKLSPPNKKIISYCKKQRTNLASLKGNYFNRWIDEDGKETKLDQKQRQNKVNQLINEIKENCKGV